MRILFSRFLGLPVAALLSLLLVCSVAAQDKAPKKAKPLNIQGKVQMMSKATSTITLLSGSSKRDVVYSADAKSLFGHGTTNTRVAVAQVKDGSFTSCRSPPGPGKPQAM